METLGVVKTIKEGTFLVEDVNGNIRELNVGDKINQGDFIFGNISNSLLEILSFNNEIIILEGGEGKTLKFDISTNDSTFGAEDVEYSPISSWLQKDNTQEVLDDTIVTDDITNEETASGDENATSSDPGNALFTARLNTIGENLTTSIEDDAQNTVNDGTRFDILGLRSDIDFEGNDISQALRNIEQIELDEERNVIISNLSVEDVLNMTNSTNELIIKGSGDDRVSLVDGEWTQGANEHIEGTEYEVFTGTIGEDVVTLKIENSITTDF